VDGYLRGFDKHFNMVLTDVTESYWVSGISRGQSDSPHLHHRRAPTVTQVTDHRTAKKNCSDIFAVLFPCDSVEKCLYVNAMGSMR